MRRLKTLAALAVLAMLTGLTAVPPATAGGVNWLDYPTAAAAQQKQAKPMLVYFHLPYCYRCKEMKRKTFSQVKVIDLLNADFIAAKVDLEKDAEVGEKLEADYTPSYLFLDAQGKQVFRIKGVFGPERFLKMLSFVKDKAYLRQTWDQYRKGD